MFPLFVFFLVASTFFERVKICVFYLDNFMTKNMKPLLFEFRDLYRPCHDTSS
jgi:hypothetical protein